MDPYAWIESSLNTIHRANWYRSVQPVEGHPGPKVMLEGRQVLNFASNDYLGWAGDGRLAQAAIAAIQEFGTGSTGSRLLSGHRALHRQLERAIASLKQTEDAMVFSSGYLANLGTVAALVGPRDLILADQYNHASLKNGATLSGAKVIDYAHCDLNHLGQVLHQLRGQFRRCLILTDSVFSMDGDLCPLPEILQLAAQFGCMVLVDEAHATGVLGPTGAGCVEHFGCSGQTLIQMGTLSKALGSLGGYVAGSTALIDFLRNRVASWIYTTGLSPADTAAALAAIALLKQEPERRTKLWQNVQYLQQQLDQHLSLASEAAIKNPADLKRLPSQSPIICLQVRDAATILRAKAKLSAAGIFAAAIRPPTVPTSRIRLTVMATHEPEHLQQLVTALKTWCDSETV
ncbi:MAG: 8-amino-7-oxononanoate synthase [Cyanothece sp. SIO1E1]|nr:8-amino-7-oxononanoate synthase [Cyanothece sp. SIO1E1]